MRIISESEFAMAIRHKLYEAETDAHLCDFVTGPGRSGAIAAVYASHLLHIPFIPQIWNAPPSCKRLLIIDTARESGKTLRKAARRYSNHNPVVIAVFEEPPRVAFWYESPKPQFYY